MKLENDRYEELMIDLALLKKQGQRQQHDFNTTSLEGTSDKGQERRYRVLILPRPNQKRRRFRIRKSGTSEAGNSKSMELMNQIKIQKPMKPRL